MSDVETRLARSLRINEQMMERVFNSKVLLDFATFKIIQMRLTRLLSNYGGEC